MKLNLQIKIVFLASIFACTTYAHSQVNIELTGAEVSISASDGITLKSGNFPGFGKFDIDFKWNPNTLTFDPVVSSLKPSTTEPAWVASGEVLTWGRAEAEATANNNSTQYRRSSIYQPSRYILIWKYLGSGSSSSTPPTYFGEGASVLCEFKGIIPQKIKSGETIQFTIELGVIDSFLSYFTTSATANVGFTSWNQQPGSNSAGNIWFKDANNKDEIKIDTYKTVNIKAATATVSAKAPTGSSRQKMAIRHQCYDGLSIGTSYVYEWK